MGNKGMFYVSTPRNLRKEKTRVFPVREFVKPASAQELYGSCSVIVPEADIRNAAASVYPVLVKSICT